MSSNLTSTVCCRLKSNMAMSGISFKNIGGSFLKSGKEQGSYLNGSRLFTVVGRTGLRHNKSLSSTKDTLETLSDTNLNFYQDKHDKQEKPTQGRYKRPSYLRSRLSHETDNQPLSHRDFSDRKFPSRVTKLARLPIPGGVHSRIDHRHGPKSSIEALEDENAQLYQDYQDMFRQNQMLQEKLADAKSSAPDSVKRVYFDRNVLREAESAYIRRIEGLQRENQHLTNKLKSLENDSLKTSPRGDNLVTEMTKDQKRLSELSQVNRELRANVERLSRENDKIVQEKSEMEKENKKLKSKVKSLEKKVEALEKELEYMMMLEYR